MRQSSWRVTTTAIEPFGDCETWPGTVAVSKPFATTSSIGCTDAPTTSMPHAGSGS